MKDNLPKRDALRSPTWKRKFVPSWKEALFEREQNQLTRFHRTLSSPQTTKPVVDGRRVLSFCSNDYLGLANHPVVKEAAIKAMKEFGVGSGASHLVVGHHELHEKLACDVARFTGRDSALIFSSGYMANMAAVSSLVGKSDFVLQDKLNHASLIDGGLLSAARFQRYQHSDPVSLSKYLERFVSDKPESRALVITDGVFSMDGNVAPLDRLADECSRYSGLLMVDDAHGIGVLGKKGRGSVDHFGLDQDSVPVLVGTFGKALGTSGAFIAGPSELIEYLKQVARPYIYTTALPPAIAAATRESLKLAEAADTERAHLKSMVSKFRDEVSAMGFQLADSSSPIQPIILGDSQKALDMSSALLENGVLVGAIRPPTVPKNTARLRVTFSANHSFDDLQRLLDALREAV